MIVGCYTLDLYCDVVACCRKGSRCDQYTGQTEGGCKAKARADGWKFVRRNGPVYVTATKAVCPECAAAGKTAADCGE